MHVGMHPEHHLSGYCMIHTINRKLFDHEYFLECVSTYESSKIVPNLGYIRVKANRTGVCIKRIAILIDLII